MIIGVSPSFEDHCAGNKDPETDGDPSEQTHNWKGPSIKVWVFLWGRAVKLASPCLSPWKQSQNSQSHAPTHTHTQTDARAHKGTKASPMHLSAGSTTYWRWKKEKKRKTDCATSSFGWTPSVKWCLKSPHPALSASHYLRGQRRQAPTRLSQANMSASAGN